MNDDQSIKHLLEGMGIDNQNAVPLLHDMLNNVDLDPHNLGEYIAKQECDLKNAINSIPHKEEYKPINCVEKFARDNYGTIAFFGLIFMLITIFETYWIYHLTSLLSH